MEFVDLGIGAIGIVAKEELEEQEWYKQGDFEYLKA